MFAAPTSTSVPLVFNSLSLWTVCVGTVAATILEKSCQLSRIPIFGIARNEWRQNTNELLTRSGYGRRRDAGGPRLIRIPGSGLRGAI